MAASQHHVSKRVSSRRFGIRTSQQLLMLVIVSILHFETSAASNDSSVQDRITSSPPTIHVKVSASHSKNSKCFDEGDHVSVQTDCRKLLLHLNIAENRIPQNETLLHQEKFPMGHISFSVGNVSTIIEEDFRCKCLTGKQMNVSEDICALTINFNESEYSIDHTLNSPLFSTGASYIKALSLRNNHMYNLRNNLLEHFAHLEVLDLSQNMLHTLNLTQTHFPFLIKLKLSKNELRWFESSPCNLTSLYIDYNNIEDLSFISNFKNLGILQASHNSVKSIPSSILNLKGLRCIFLDDNKIKNIAPLQNISLKNMFRISLSHNEIEQVNADFTRHTELHILEVDNNNISYFNFTGVKNLVYLDLCNNRISEIKPTHALRKSKILGFRLCNNFLSTAPVIMKMEKLETLELSNNNLRDLDKMFKNKRYLKYLLLSNVSLGSLDFLKDLPDLEELEVDDNNITHFPKQLLGSNIKKLHLSNNPLEPIYCPSSERGKEIIRTCNMSFNERNENIHLDLWMKSKEINKKMECLLSNSSSKAFLNQCSSYSGARKVALKQYLFIMLIFVLNIF